MHQLTLNFPFTTKENFLQKLKGKKIKYKKYLGSPLRYVGGKSWAVGYIIEHLPENIERLVSPFFGGGSVEIAVAKELGIPVLGFDIFDILVNYWKFQINYPELLYEELLKLKPNKKTYEKVRSELRKHWKKEKILNPLKLAVYFCFHFNFSYGPNFLDCVSSHIKNKKNYERLLKKVRDFNVKNIEVNCASFEEIIPKFEYDFFYCDPPYFLGQESSVFRGLYPSNKFPIFHKNFNHELLRDLLKEHKGGFILSYNDVPTIREWYSGWCKIIELPVKYTMNYKNLKETKELLIIKI